MKIPVLVVVAGALSVGFSLVACTKETVRQYPNSKSDLVLIDEYTTGGGAAGLTFGILRLKTKEQGKDPIDVGYYSHVQRFAPRWVGPEKLMLCLEGARYYLVRQLDLEGYDGVRRTVMIDPGCA